MKLIFKTFLIIVIFSSHFPLFASDALSLKVANLSQDLIALSKELAQMRLEVETLRYENKNLKEQIARIASTEDQLKKQAVQMTAFNTTLETYKKSMLAEVSHEIDELSKETQKAIDQLAKSIVSNSEMVSKHETTPKDTFKFSDDYSKEGTAYTVKAGDTLSVIALKQGSTTRDIQNANRIADPRDLKAGQVIFIPIKKLD